nr:hypothetical protein [Gammaproteobacteria bacterium]
MVFLSTQICYTIKVEDFIIAKPASHHQAESRPLISAKNHKLNSSKNPIFLIDCSNLELDEKLTCVSLQGVLNRNAPRLFLDYGYYDKLSDRTTNEEFINDELWFGTYRSMIGRQDIRNLEYYQSRYQLDVQGVADYRQLMRDFKTSFRGCVIWDDSLPETISIAVMLSGLESLLILSPGQVWLAGELGLLIAEDLRGRWRDRIDLYRWAVDHLLPRCKPGYAASIDPGWEHPEFFDYIIQNKIFTYSLATDNPNRLFRFGQKLLLLLFAGPRRLRNVLFMA